MNLSCPACRNPMTAVQVAGHYGATIELDHCAPCGLLWFDTLETSSLTREGLMALFRRIVAAPPATQRLPEDALHCPRCRGGLTRIHNMSRYGRMIHYRCGATHGHAVTHTQFLAEKGLLRAVTTDDLQAPAARLLALSCSQCGAPLNALNDCHCPWCGSPAVVLDLQHAVDSLEAHDQERRERDRLRAQDQDALFDRLMRLMDANAR